MLVLATRNVSRSYRLMHGEFNMPKAWPYNSETALLRTKEPKKTRPGTCRAPIAPEASKRFRIVRRATCVHCLEEVVEGYGGGRGDEAGAVGEEAEERLWGVAGA